MNCPSRRLDGQTYGPISIHTYRWPDVWMDGRLDACAADLSGKQAAEALKWPSVRIERPSQHRPRGPNDRIRCEPASPERIKAGIHRGGFPKASRPDCEGRCGWGLRLTPGSGVRRGIPTSRSAHPRGWPPLPRQPPQARCVGVRVPSCSPGIRRRRTPRPRVPNPGIARPTNIHP